MARQTAYGIRTPEPDAMALHDVSSFSRPHAVMDAEARPRSVSRHRSPGPGAMRAADHSIVSFATQMVCFLWFEPFDVLRDAACFRPRRSFGVSSPSLDSQPRPAFVRWARDVLHTTQVSNSVIIIALLFVWRLKKMNLQVKGMQGSEYRLLTIALMLGNKFLDDNTYTNKTWADVTTLTVRELLLMEMEFLTNMKYDLFVSAEQWLEWHQLLQNFSAYRRAQLSPPGPMSLQHINNPAFPHPSGPNGITRRESLVYGSGSHGNIPSPPHTNLDSASRGSSPATLPPDFGSQKRYSDTSMTSSHTSKRHRPSSASLASTQAYGYTPPTFDPETQLQRYPGPHVVNMDQMGPPYGLSPSQRRPLGRVTRPYGRPESRESEQNAAFADRRASYPQRQQHEDPWSELRAPSRPRPTPNYAMSVCPSLAGQHPLPQHANMRRPEELQFTTVCAPGNSGWRRDHRHTGIAGSGRSDASWRVPDQHGLVDYVRTSLEATGHQSPLEYVNGFR